MDARTADEGLLVQGLRSAGLLPGDGAVRMTPLGGGVASDIWTVEQGATTFVVKRALPKLRVAADWRAPVSRNAAEAHWLRLVAGFAPEAVPRVLHLDEAAGWFAMTWFPPGRHPVWKAELQAGRAVPSFAAAVGHAMALIHDRTAGRADVASEFANDALFQSLRLEPYLEATAARHPSVADALLGLSRATLACREALVHGDMSPKNILCGPHGPIFLDAECAWYGDPAFDVAFCLNHLLLKCLWTPQAGPSFLRSFEHLRRSYLGALTAVSAAAVEQRAAALLPALLLARIDGKSPVEYITTEEARERVRATALPLIRRPPETLEAVRRQWAADLHITLQD